MYKLVIQDDEGKTTVVPLIRDELTIGRKEGNTIRLTERNVSRRHARLIRQNGSITIEDLNSYNGIRVNGSRIQGRCQIRETDRVQIGDYLIELKSEAHEKGDTLSERTIPIERIDPHATTPVPDNVEPNDSAIATTRIHKTESAAVLGTGFVGAVSEPLAPLADTDPGATPVATPAGAPAVVTPPVAPAPHPASHARLVILSTTFAGREFELDKPAMVIGRTEDNDVCINHRSISRHHAKVVRENGRHAIVDLQSSNGVRVNGEEYGKVELRRADLIDLGHVRLRFVEAGEDFLFGRDAQAVDVVPQGSSRIAMWLALAVLVIGAAVVLFLVLGGQPGGASDDPEGKNSKSAQKRGGDDPPTGSGATHPVEIPSAADAGDVDVVDNNVAPQVSDEVSKLLDSARKSIKSEKWNAALTAAKAALQQEPANRDALGLRDQAESEISNEGIYNQFTRAVASRDYPKVSEHFRRLDPESVYRAYAQEEHDRVKQEYIALKSREGKKFADRGQCPRQQRLALEVVKVWQEAARAVQSHTCKQSTPPSTTATAPSGTTQPTGETRAEAPTGGDPPVSPPPAGGNDGNDSPPAANGTPTLAQLQEQLLQASVDGDYDKTLRLCEQAVDKKPGNQILGACVIAGCKKGNGRSARRFLRRINDPDMPKQLRQLCFGAGIKDL